MARIGMKYPVFALETAYTEGSAITYATGEFLAHAISATITPNRRNNPLYGDDVKIENDKGLTDYTIALTVDKVPAATRAKLLGDKAQGGSTPTHYSVIDTNPPYVGFGYLSIMQENNEKKVKGYWFHRVQFSVDNETDQTKGEQIQWGTYPLTGTGFGVVLDNTGDTQFYDYMDFATEAAALAWLKARAGIT